MDSDVPRFEIRRLPVDATRDGTFGGRPDFNRVHVAGPVEYLVDGKEVSKAEYERLVEVARSQSSGR